MKCPKCSNKLKITNTRHFGTTVTRDRDCFTCNLRWKTYESLEGEGTQKLKKGKTYAK